MSRFFMLLLLSGLLPLEAYGVGVKLVINVGMGFSNTGRHHSELTANRNEALAEEEEEEAVYKQTISGNSSTDTVTLDYVEPDGSVVTQLTDFRHSVQVTRVVLLGEEELQEPSHQVLCFVSAFTGDLIPPEAVMKLRQKHPGTVRVAESDEGEVVQDSQYLFKYKYAYRISSHLSALCKDAKKSTYTSSHELHTILTSEASHLVESLTDKFPGYESLPRCATLSENALTGDKLLMLPCQCSRQVFFLWYPCALKYCRNQDGNETRCGIKTCRKTKTFRYPAKSKFHCRWDQV